MIDYEELEKIEIEDFWDDILSDDTEIELDIDYINKAQAEALEQARDFIMDCWIEKLIREVIADVVEEELRRAGF